jgi:hypothetical protein
MVCDLLGMTPCSLVGDYQRFGENFCFHIQGLLGCEDDDSRFIRNAGYSLSDYIQDRRLQYNVSPPRKPQTPRMKVCFYRVLCCNP